MNSSAPARLAARTTSSKVASGFPAAMFSRIDPLNRKFSWSTTPKTATQMVYIVFPDIDAIDLDEALIVRM